MLPLWPQREGPVGSELSRSDDDDADGRDCFLSHTLSSESLKNLNSKPRQENAESWRGRDQRSITKNPRLCGAR